MISKKTVLPPLIQQFFNKYLLTHFKKDPNSEQANKMYIYLLNKYKPHLLGKKNKKKFELMQKEFLELYERAKTKEENNKKEDRHSITESLYLIRPTGKVNGKIFDRFREGFYRYTFNRWNNEI